MKFEWQYTGSQPRKLRAALKHEGVSASLIKVAVYHGGKMQINGEDRWTVDLVNPGDYFSLILPSEKPMIMLFLSIFLSKLFMRIETS